MCTFVQLMYWLQDKLAFLYHCANAFLSKDIYNLWPEMEDCLLQAIKLLVLLGQMYGLSAAISINVAHYNYITEGRLWTGQLWAWFVNGGFKFANEFVSKSISQISQYLKQLRQKFSSDAIFSHVLSTHHTKLDNSANILTSKFFILLHAACRFILNI